MEEDVEGEAIGKGSRRRREGRYCSVCFRCFVERDFRVILPNDLSLASFRP